MQIIRRHQPVGRTVSPFDAVNDLSAELSRLFGVPLAGFPRGDTSFGWAPALDLREDKDNLVASVELPGLKKDDIEVSVHDGILSVSGERTQEKKHDEAGAYRSERIYGRFHRTVVLPKPVKLEAVKAAYRDGILTVTLPKTEEAKPKQIQVSVG